MIEKGRYKHYKGNDYQVLDVVRHSETEEVLVLYKPLYTEQGASSDSLGNLWVRPLEMFLETVVIEGKEMPRFAYIGEKKAPQSL